MANSTVIEPVEEEALCTPPTIIAPTSEQEIPPERSSKRSNPTETISPQEVDALEKANRVRKAEQEIHLKDNAFKLLCCCLLAYAVFFIIDTTVINFGGQSSDVLSSAIDMDKTIITFLIGYLFATEKPKN